MEILRIILSKDILLIFYKSTELTRKTGIIANPDLLFKGCLSMKIIDIRK